MDLKTLVKIRGTTRASVASIISQCKSTLEANWEEKEDNLMIILQNLREKQSDLKQMNREVIMQLDEEKLGNGAFNVKRLSITLDKPYKEHQKNCN